LALGGGVGVAGGRRGRRRGRDHEGGGTLEVVWEEDR